MANKTKKEDKYVKAKPIPHGSIVEGINLLIDPNTQKLCETYNQSSGNTRSVLYVLLVICIVSVMSILNCNSFFNTTNARIENYTNELNQYHDKLAKLTRNDEYKKDSLILAEKIRLTIKKEDFLIAANSENDYVRFNLIGFTIDSSNLTVVAGISITVLLLVLRFMLTREEDNLRIALNSITERYTDNADKDDFLRHLSQIKVKTKKIAENDAQISDEYKTKNILSDINYVRRRHHYNFLSMNDIFTIPYLDTSRNKLQSKFTGKFVGVLLYYLFLSLYLLLMLNDFWSIRSSYNHYKSHTIFVEIICVICLSAIIKLCNLCVNHKATIIKLFISFRKNKYTYINLPPNPKRLSLQLLAFCVLAIIIFFFFIGYNNN